MTTLPHHTDAPEHARAVRREALDQLSATLYAELREIAHRHCAARDDDTLMTTSLVHETYLRLADHSRPEWNGRAHFLALAAVAMRHILADRAKAQRAFKRGGAQRSVPLDDELVAANDQSESLLEVKDALDWLARIDERISHVVECRVFGGLTNEETASALGVTVRTVERDWAKARTLLRTELRV